ncbi:MAG: putative Class aldolase/adducin-like protein [Rhodospirillales bacterium]|nr:putative Class aldolase/adducin-like protein [Rhodospirillales bacterium]
MTARRYPRSAYLSLALGVVVAMALYAAPVLAQQQAPIAPEKLIDDLVAANHVLYQESVLDGYGHISVRSPTNPQHFLMSRSLAPALVTAADIMEFDLEGAPIDPRGRLVYQERFIHSEIYKADPKVNSVVHSHSPSVIPFSVTKVKLRPIQHTASFLDQGAPVFDIAKKFGVTNLMVTDNAQGKALAEVLGGNAVALLRAHGDVVVGPDIPTVVSRAVYTEVNAKALIQATTLGGPIAYVSHAESEFRNKPTPPGAEQRAWDLWKAKAVGK